MIIIYLLYITIAPQNNKSNAELNLDNKNELEIIKTRIKKCKNNTFHKNSLNNKKLNFEKEIINLQVCIIK